MKILSPMSYGNGAYVVHQDLARQLAGYTIVGYDPRLSYFPFALKRVLRDRPADIIHTVPDYSIFTGRADVPTVVSFQNYVLDSFMRKYSTFLQRLHYMTDLRLMTQRAVQRASVITAVSEFTSKIVRTDLGCTRKIEVIYNGVDTEIFHPRRKRSSRRKPFKVLFSGNLTRRKGAHWLPDVARNLHKNVEILVTRGLRQMAPLYSLNNLRDIGAYRHEDMPDLYRSVDALFLPSVREGLSLAVLEAMACGLPVVTHDSSSMPELIIAGKGGYLCKIGDTDELAGRINLLADSDSLCREMGEYNRARVETLFNLRAMIDGYERIFERLYLRR